MKKSLAENLAKAFTKLCEGLSRSKQQLPLKLFAWESFLLHSAKSSIVQSDKISGFAKISLSKLRVCKTHFQRNRYRNPGIMR